MAYNNLTRDTAQTPERRREEADNLLKMLEGVGEQMTEKEQEFVGDMSLQTWCSPKQLLWLRDLKDKYL